MVLFEITNFIDVRDGELFEELIRGIDYYKDGDEIYVLLEVGFKKTVTDILEETCDLTSREYISKAILCVDEGLGAFRCVDVDDYFNSLGLKVLERNFGEVLELIRKKEIVYIFNAGNAKLKEEFNKREVYIL